MNSIEHQTDSELGGITAGPSCSRCRAILTEAGRRVEGRTVFVRYTCGRTGRHGQWLTKFAKDQRNV